jgi:acyl-CoA synthetase (AMP-forming)/AMP-acid ligase II
VEEVLAMHPKVAEGVVVGVADRRLGERTVACVRLRDGCDTLTIEELRAHFAAAQVTRQFWPEDIVAFDELPATAAGKTRKAELREWLTRRGEA